MLKSFFSSIFVLSTLLEVSLSQIVPAAVNICLAGTWQDASGNCRIADPGWYVPADYATEEIPCPVGTFSAYPGASSCCECCSGWYADQTTQTHCIACPNVAVGNTVQQQGTSFPGATSKDQCFGGMTPFPLTSCVAPSAGYCPTISSPTPSGVYKRQDVPLRCERRGHQMCPIMSGRGGFECVDVQNDLESCGGCVGEPDGSLDYDLSGVDCSALPGVDRVRCVEGNCHVDSCAPSWRKSKHADHCVHEGQSSRPFKSDPLVFQGIKWF